MRRSALICMSHFDEAEEECRIRMHAALAFNASIIHDHVTEYDECDKYNICRAV